MGRAPCCDKERVRKGQWSAEEDEILKSYMESNGTATNWIALPKKIGLNRCGKSCRLRWLNYLRPNIKHGDFSEEEDSIISHMYFTIGSRWSIIAEKLQGRTDNDIKNYWNTKLQRKFAGKRKKSCRRLSSYGILSEKHEKNNHIDYINLAETANPNCTTFTISNSHLMPSNWTHSTPKIHYTPTTTVRWPSFNMISFSTTIDYSKQQQQQQHAFLYDVSSSSSIQEQNTINNNNVGATTFDTILREMEAVLLANDSPSQEINALDALPCNITKVVNNNASYEESEGSLEWGDMTSLISFPSVEIDDYINWEEIFLPEAPINQQT